MDFTWITENQSLARMLPFLSVLVVMAIVEAVFPNVDRRISRRRRWVTNLVLVVLGSVCIRLIFGAGAAAVALFAEDRQIGLLHWLGLDVHAAWIVVAVVLLFDLAIYVQHVVFHHIPLVWRFHAVHHADPDLDVTSGLRFHPVEFVLSMAIKCALVLAVGAPAEAVILFEILLNATAMFSHSNVKLPTGLDQVLRKVMVTPDMHRIHHKTEGADINTNFGFSFSLWDHIFGTYAKTQYNHGHTGLRSKDPETSSGLGGVLMMPFRR